MKVVNESAINWNKYRYELQFKLQYTSRLLMSQKLFLLAASQPIKAFFLALPSP